jgi:hypothetical protein
MRLRTAKAEPSILADDAFDVSQEGIAVHHRRLRIIENPFFSDHTLWIDQKKCSDRCHDFLVENAVTPNGFSFDEVTQQRIRQFEGFGERLLRERVVGADGENLNAESLEPFVVGLPGR